MFRRSIVDDVRELARRRNALILAHFYQSLEIQELAHFVGDSLKLSLDAMNAKGDMIVFCGVYFMAEQAAVLNPDVPVYIPDKDAICRLADMLSVEDIVAAKKKHPDAIVVMYVNSKAIHKAYADYIVTSANAVKVIEEIPNDTIIFGPDRNLAEFVAERTGKNIIPVPENGHCYVHVMFNTSDISKFREKGFSVTVHPECPRAVRSMADFIGSTKQMYDYIRNSAAKKIVVGTEVGFIDRVKCDFPDKTIEPLKPDAICEDMKKITLEKLYMSLRDKKYRVIVERDIAKRIRNALNKTFQLLGII